ncbi:hypothetical protein D9M68_823950 [compost metagenome]
MRLQQRADPAVAGQQRGERNAGHGGGQRERQVHQRVHDLLAREGVTHQHPGHQQAEHHVHTGRDERGAEGQAVGRQHARRGDGLPELRPGQREGLEHQRRERDQHDQAQVKHREAERELEARQHTARGATGTGIPWNDDRES